MASVIIDPDDEIIDTAEWARITNTVASRWHKARLTGEGPPYFKIGNLVRYSKKQSLAWLAARQFNSTSEAA